MKINQREPKTDRVIIDDNVSGIGKYVIVEDNESLCPKTSFNC